MNNDLKMPARCALLSEDEMIYTEGGYSYGDFLGNAATAVGAVVLGASYFWGIAISKEWLGNEKNREGNPLTVMGRAVDEIVVDMGKSPANFVRDAVSTTMVVGLAPLSILLMLF